MKNWLDWRVEEAGRELEPQEPVPDSQRAPSAIRRFGWGTAVFIIVLLMGWILVRGQLQRADAAWQQQVQTLLDWQQQAIRQQDGDRFFAVVADDSPLRAAWLRPENWQPAAAGLTVTRVQPQDDVLAANLQWLQDGHLYQRLAFYETSPSGLRQIAGAATYWGELQQRRTDWGTLIFYAQDAAWAAQIDAFVQQTRAALCAADCPPLMVVVRADWAETAVPHTLHIPSPRLLGLDAAGAPSDRFWAALRQRVEDLAAPITLRIALPPRLPVGIHLTEYEQAAADFMAQHPRVTIELVTLEALPTDPAQLAGFDGAVFPPTVDWIAAGAVHDLTDYAYTDPTLDAVDFYRQIWQGAWWRDRMWMLPQAAEMRVIFFDCSVYAEVGLAEPLLGWTWAEMEADLAALDAALPFAERPFPNYRFYDISADVLYAHALTHGAPRTGAVADTLAWYAEMAQHPRLMPDVTTFTPEERLHYRFRWWSPLWVDELVYYEHQQQIAGCMGVVPFPGSAQFEGVTPLHLQGGFVSGGSPHPRTAWTWLNFLSTQPTAARYRLIPARPSVAAATGYWPTLPRALSEPVRVAFPFARAVTLDPQPAFAWESVTAVVQNQRTPAQAAQQALDLPWFTAP